jgi:hypothetical protein
MIRTIPCDGDSEIGGSLRKPARNPPGAHLAIKRGVMI